MARSVALRQMLAVMVVLSVSSTAFAQDFSSLFQGLKFALHGNYCGPNHGDPNYEVEPVDELDALCKFHDECYDKSRGGFYLDCGCDMRFINGINELQSRLTPEQQQTAGLMTMYFSGSQCSCKTGYEDGEEVRETLQGSSMEEKAKCL